MSCTRCGECCFPYAIGMQHDPDARRWLTYHGLVVKDTSEERMTIYGTSRCQMLIFNPDGTTSCGCYADRPSICRDYWCAKAKEGDT